MTTSQRIDVQSSAMAPAVAAPRTAQARALRNLLVAVPYLLPSLIIFTFFVFVPLLKTINLSLYLTNPIGLPVEFTGLDNYKDALSDETVFNSLKVSLTFALYVVPTTLIFALFLAVLANSPLRGVSVFRVIFASTIAVSGATASLIFLFLFHPAIGVFNYILDLLHQPRVAWLTSEATALISVSLVTIWLTLGFNTVIFLAGLQGIPQELYESARIDGAGFWSSFRHITIPMISPTIFFLIVVSTLGALQTFTQVNIMTRGGPVESTQVIVHLIYRAFYFNGQYGVAATLSVLLFLIMFVLTIIQFGVLERRVHYG
ncbi:MAG: sugar ABC transporter permease [Chloroflexi bacterium]|nr:sugar ABC transporter permease [Chloroflexota bacterium]MBI3734858.1 sugar ABC transporter permease [Chloroflexota bacterium]